MQPRRKRLIRPDVQLRVVLIAFAVASLVLLAVFHLTLTAVGHLCEKWASSDTALLVLEELRGSLLGRFLLGVLVLIPLSVGVGVIYSFKFAGPLYRFQRFFDGLKDGSWKVRCSLRKGDDLQDLCASINGALASIDAFLEENRRILEEVSSLLVGGKLSADPQGADRGAALERRIADVLSTYERRLSPGESPRRSGAGGSPGAPVSADTLPTGPEEEAQPEAPVPQVAGEPAGRVS